MSVIRVCVINVYGRVSRREMVWSHFCNKRIPEFVIEEISDVRFRKVDQ